MDLSIIIVSWNVKEKLRENLGALFKSVGDFAFEVFVVDNNSADGTAVMVKNEFPQVKLIANAENLGFAKANNQALRLCSEQARCVLLLNPDMKVFPDTLDSMISWMENHKQASVAGCRLINEKGETIRHARRFPGFFDQLAIVLKIPHLFPSVLNRYLRADFDYDQSAKADSVRGGFFMIRSEVIKKIGLLDERFFVWFEEVDYCKRVALAGGEVWYTNAAECVDYIGQSFKQIKRGVAQKYFRDSMLEYFKKWHPVWQSWLLRLAWPMGSLIAVIFERLNFKARAKT